MKNEAILITAHDGTERDFQGKYKLGMIYSTEIDCGFLWRFADVRIDTSSEEERNCADREDQQQKEQAG